MEWGGKWMSGKGGADLLEKRAAPVALNRLPSPSTSAARRGFCLQLGNLVHHPHDRRLLALNDLRQCVHLRCARGLRSDGAPTACKLLRLRGRRRRQALLPWGW